MKRSILSLACLVCLWPMPAMAQDKLTVLLDWFVNPDHGPLVVAEARGLFAAAGLEIEMVEPADPNLPPRLTAAQQADIAVSYQPQLHLLVDQGLPLVRFATLVATPLNSLVVLKDGPVKTIADLKGRKIGYSVAGTEEAVLGAMLASAGLSLDDVELINVNFSLSPSVISGQVAAVIGAYRNFELNQMDIEGHPGRAFYPEEHGVPPFDQLILVTHPDRIGDPALRRFTDVLELAVQYMINHPETAWDMFIARHPDLDDELNRRAWADTLPRFALRPAALDTARYDRFAAFLESYGLIDKVPELSDYATVLPAAPRP